MKSRSALLLLLWLYAASALVIASSAGAQIIDSGFGRAERARFTCGAETVEACVERLRSALRAELAVEPLALVKSSRSCPGRDTLRCTVMFDECMPVAGIIAYQLLKLGAPGAASVTEMQLARGKGSDALTAVALRALAVFQSPVAVPTASRLLGEEDVTCRWKRR